AWRKESGSANRSWTRTRGRTDRRSAPGLAQAGVEVGSEIVPESFAVVVVETSHGRYHPDFGIVSVRKRHCYGCDPYGILVENRPRLMLSPQEVVEALQPRARVGQLEKLLL